MHPNHIYIEFTIFSKTTHLSHFRALKILHFHFIFEMGYFARYNDSNKIPKIFSTLFHDFIAARLYKKINLSTMH